MENRQNPRLRQYYEEGGIKLYIPFETRVGVPTELASIAAYALLFMHYCLIEQYTSFFVGKVRLYLHYIQKYCLVLPYYY